MIDHRQWTRLFLACVLGISVLSSGSADAATAAEGEAIFTQVCFACHRVGGGQLVGPDLADIQDRRDVSWLRPFIRSSQTVIQQGDAYAVALFEKFNKIPMPDNALSDDEIDSVLAYIAQQSESAASAPAVAAPPERVATEEDIALGLALFQGTTRLANRGPTCTSCHDVKNDAVIGGGVLAKELTSVFSRMGAPGVAAILGSPPFPVMQQAYDGRPLEEDEIFALVSFLRETDQHQAFSHPRDYGFRLFYSGLGGVGLLFVIYGFAWSGRKRASTNQKIYDRQIRSQ